MKAKKVAILSNSRDEHTHQLVVKLEELGGKVYRFDSDRLSSHFKIHLDIHQQNKAFYCETPVGVFNSEEIHSVWVRRPYTIAFVPNNVHQRLIEKETLAVMRALPSLFPSTTKVVDLPKNVINASRKIEGLISASSIGLTIPRSIITTSEKESREFIDQYKGDVIIKPIDTGGIAYDEQQLAVPTSVVKKDIDLSLVRNCPTLFQENIKKKYELRITIIGKKVFPVAFDVQNIPEAKTDFRKSFLKIDEVKHSLIKIPKNLEMKLLKLLEQYNLNYGAIDMALTPEGEYVFFELNPAGQFLWLDHVTEGLHLGEEMAKFLLAE